MKITSHCSHCDEKYELDFALIGRKAKCRNCSEEFIIKEVEENIVKTVEVKQVEKSPDLIIKPHKMSFLLLNGGFVFMMILGLFSLLIFPIASLIFFVLGFIILGFQTVVYKKSLYTLTDRKLVYKTGSIISDNTVEVNLDKITLVRSRLGFIQNKLFGTGNLYVKTAGSSSSKIKFVHIENTLEIYEELQKRMKKNGFSLQKNKLVQTAKPHPLGVFGEIGGKLLSFGIVIIYFFIGIIEALKEIPGDVNLGLLSGGVIFLIYALFTGVALTLSYLDLSRRKYEVFTDSIYYSEGFLTKNYSFIPMENISDTENEQSFLSKVLGLHDVVISSQGASNKVLFKNMVGGQKMMESIKYLKDKTIMGTKDMIDGEVRTESLIGFKDQIEEPLDYDKEFTGEYKMDIAKSMASVIFTVIALIPTLLIGGEAIFVIFIVVLPSIVRIAIGIFSTKFIVSNSSIEYNYDFFSHKHNSFSVEKITKVIVTESLIDKLFNTCSVQFYSIGSSSAITFRNIKKTSDICDKLLSKVGIYKKEDVKSIPTNFNIIEFVKAHVFSSIFLIIFLTGTIIAGTMNIIFFGIAILILAIIGIKYLYLTFYYSKRFYTNNLYKHFIESKKGIVIQKTHYALFRHIKTTHSTKNIGTTVGNISLNVSGEQKAEAKGKNNVNLSSVFTSNSINIHYVKQSHIVVNLFDSIYLDRELDNSEVLSSKPDVKNSIFWIGVILAIIILISISITFAVTGTLFRIKLLNVLLVLTLILIPIIGPIIWSIKVMKYSLQKDRVVFSSGIFYKKILSIPYIRFNFIENDTGFVNKIFGNGNVGIFTIGSGKKELNVKNIKNYSEVYNLLKKD